jgi:MFS superfamily sulfate permease-like transporter
LKENWSKDLVSGFILSLIALPLCLGIAGASNFPPAAGLIAAIVGGMLVSRINGSFVTINGPAAGLISVNAAAVLALGHGDKVAGYPLALAAIMVSGVLILLLGLLKAGKLASMVPSNAVHGMLAAIGVIIISKQIHAALGVKPTHHETLPLLAEIPNSLMHMHQGAAIIAAVSFLILVVHPFIKLKVIKRLPAPLWVMAAAIPMAHFLHLDGKLLISLDPDPTKAITLPNFSAIGTGTFWTAVLSISLVTGLETVLSATAVDRLDPFRRKSNLSRDMGAMGLGSAVSASIGGLPMIAEIVRSSANVTNGARTQWSNFFHGLFLLVFMLLLVPVINMIPVSALAAMLVFTGLRLASPKTFTHAWHLGWDQLVVMLTTLLVTLASDLLLGIGAGIVMQIALNLVLGSGLKGFFRNQVEVVQADGNQYLLKVERPSIFTSFLSLQRHLTSIPKGAQVLLDLANSKMVDCTVMENVTEFGRRYEEEGGSFKILGLDGHKPFAHHPMAGRVRKSATVETLRRKLNERQQGYHQLSESLLAYYKPDRVTSNRDLHGFPMFAHPQAQSESDKMIGRFGKSSFELVDLHCSSGFGAERSGGTLTALFVKPSQGTAALPVFVLEQERFLDDLVTMGNMKDIDFSTHPDFSKRWLLRGPDESAIRAFFGESLLRYLETVDKVGLSVHCDGMHLLIQMGERSLSVQEAEQLLGYGKAIASAAKLT